jgi:hypothetical protein
VSNRRPVNGHNLRKTPRPPALAVPSFVGVAVEDWSDLPPAAYPLDVIDGVILPRLQAGADLIRTNAYRCDGCQGLTITYDRHPGIAPAMVDHNRFDRDTRCPGMGVSLGYPPDLPAEWEPSHEWHRPSEDVLLTLGDAAIEHVLRGGLLLRPIALPERVEA